MLDVRYPMENGIVRDWEDMRHVWNYTFNAMLKIDPTHTKVRREQIANLCLHQLVTDPADGGGDENRKRLVQEMFETYRFKGVSVAVHGVPL